MHHFENSDKKKDRSGHAKNVLDYDKISRTCPHDNKHDGHYAGHGQRTRDTDNVVLGEPRGHCPCTTLPL